MYVIFDSKAQVYNKPFYLVNDQVAIRAAQDLMITGSDSQIRNHPEDFTMFKVGEYDDTTAQIKPYNEFTVMCRFHELAGPDPDQEAPFDPPFVITGDQEKTA